MLVRLCIRLYPHQVFVHVDAKSDIVPFQQGLFRAGCEHVSLLPTRVPVNWAGYSQVEAMRLLIEAASSRTAPDDYMVMMSGQDYPLRDVRSFAEYLAACSGKQYIKSFIVQGTEKKYTSQITRRHHRDLPFLRRCSGRLRRLRNVLIRFLEVIDCRQMPAAPEGMKIAHGETHWALTAECAVELNNSVTPEIESFFKTTFAPDEKFFHSLFLNSRYTKSAQGGSLVPYTGPGNWRYTNFHFLNSDHTTFTHREWPSILGTEKFFVRKVESVRSWNLLQIIDRETLDIETAKWVQRRINS